MAGRGSAGEKARAERLASREFAAPAGGAEADIASGGQWGNYFSKKPVRCPSEWIPLFGPSLESVWAIG